MKKSAMRILGLLLAAGMIGLSVGCASKSPTSTQKTTAGGTDKPSAGEEASQAQGGKAEARGLGEDGSIETLGVADKGQEGDETGRPDKVRIFFDFDSSQLTEKARATLRGHAAYLKAHPKVEATLEGHADERGTREYNLALGERRAKSARRMLFVQGVGSKRVEIVSYGEERPWVDGHTEEAYAKNRRVRIRYHRVQE